MRLRLPALIVGVDLGGRLVAMLSLRGLGRRYHHACVGEPQRYWELGTATEGMILGQITDEPIAMMRRRIGFPNPTPRPQWLSKYVEDVQVKTSSFGGRSVIVDNDESYWNDEDVILVWN
ncbi:hypothetical protein [Rhizorhabdus dicambivorans]|uniref:Uncharacterized protein n=1 Tax=Rhizorhabdus dicambivorans TaxID=1850238 RepID=A0A2A4FX14_9SPHN|nr:hypothetical protein [Rhizorhabdus dicambivorans]ATE66876.1 hypothetical protein CMV14_22710 [Rhizorhabdus dicambivorans]PCE42256.1 hypothetical protein COO09_11580 [Rhizorhabdus dicambivorans]